MKKLVLHTSRLGPSTSSTASRIAGCRTRSASHVKSRCGLWRRSPSRRLTAPRAPRPSRRPSRSRGWPARKSPGSRRRPSAHSSPDVVSAADDLAALHVDRVPPRSQGAHGLEAVLDHVAVELDAVAVGIVEVDAAAHVVLDRGLHLDPQLTQLAVGRLELGEAADLPRRVMQARLVRLRRLAGGQLEEREVVVLGADAEEHGPPLAVLVSYLQPERPRVERLGPLGITNLQHDVAELPGFDHGRAPVREAPGCVHGQPLPRACASIAPPQRDATIAPMRSRVASSGSEPTPAVMLSTRCSSRLVAGITQVTAGWARIHLRKNCAQLWQPNAAVHAGSAWPRTRWKSPPSENGRFTRTAMPRSRASGRMRRSASRSPSE